MSLMNENCFFLFMSFFFSLIQFDMNYATKPSHSMNDNEMKKDNCKRKLEKQTKEDKNILFREESRIKRTLATATTEAAASAAETL